MFLLLCMIDGEGLCNRVFTHPQNSQKQGTSILYLHFRHLKFLAIIGCSPDLFLIEVVTRYGFRHCIGSGGASIAKGIDDDLEMLGLYKEGPYQL